MNRCTNCVLPEFASNVVFDKEGVCNYCRAERKLTYRGESDLVKLLDSHRRRDSKYDCVVAVSGGRDSTFTLLKVAKDYGMKTLAVNYENPFTHPQAKANVENAVKALGVDLVTFKLRNRIHERSLRNNLVAWFRKPSPALVPMICVACKTMYGNFQRIANKYDIHCIVTGGNRLEDTTFKTGLHGILTDEKVTPTSFRLLRSVLALTLKNPAYFTLISITAIVQSYLFGHRSAIGVKLLGGSTTRIPIFHFIEWNEQEVLSRIRSELSWESPPELKSTWRFDCRVSYLKDFMYMKTLGMTEKDDFYAKMVREGLITREEALLRLEEENKLEADEIRLLLNELGIKDIRLLKEIDENIAQLPHEGLISK